MKGYKVMVAETPSGDPVCIAIHYPLGNAGAEESANDKADVLTYIGIPAWVEEEA